MKKFLLALLVISILTVSMLLVACEQEKEPVETPATTTQAPVEKEQPKGHVHTFKTNVVEPTCVADGYTENRCTGTNCNEYFRDNYVAHDPDDHVYGGYTTVVKATCQQPLVEQATCIHCGDVTEKVGTLANHSYTVVMQRDDNTCCEDGWEMRKCQWCDEQKEVTLVASASKHSWSEWSVHTSNIDSNGNCVYGSKQRTCNYCGYVEVQTLMPHTNPDFSDTNVWLVYVETVAPTCKTAGYEVWECKHCGEIIHMNHTNPTGHTYGDWIVDPHDDHLQIRECIDCHHREEKVVD